MRRFGQHLTERGLLGLSKLRQKTLRTFCELYPRMYGVWPTTRAVMERSVGLKEKPSGLKERAARDYANAILRIKTRDSSEYVERWFEQLVLFRNKLDANYEGIRQLDEIGLTICPYCGLQFDPEVSAATKATLAYFKGQQRPMRYKRKGGSKAGLATDDTFTQV